MENAASPLLSLSDYLGRFVLWFEWLIAGIEIASIIILLRGLALFAIAFLGRDVTGRDGHERRHRLNRGRLVLGQHILAALEVLIVADLIRTMLYLTPQSVVLLGALVAIRSLVSFFLDREISALSAD